MPSYNRSFDLSIADIDLIEEALRARGRELSILRLGLSGDVPAEVEQIRALEQEQRSGEVLLGRLHDQKVFFRPRAESYFSG